MGQDLPHPPIWLLKLDVVRPELERETRPATPDAGILAACRLSDELRLFALACLGARHPDFATPELETLYAEQRDDWMDERRRLFAPHSGDNRDGSKHRSNAFEQS